MAEVEYRRSRRAGPNGTSKLEQLLHLATLDTSWMARGLCTDHGCDLWFSKDPDEIAEAKTICARCPVADNCLEFAFETREEFGIWGGLTPRERHALRRKLQRRRIKEARK